MPTLSLSSLKFPVILESMSSYNTTTTFIDFYDINNSFNNYSRQITFLDGLAVISIESETDDTLSPNDNHPTSVSIGGVTATLAVAADVDTFNRNSVSTSIWYAEVSAGANDVNIAFTTTPYRIRIGAYSIQDYTSTTPVFTGISGEADGDFPTSRSITTNNLNAGSALIAGFSSGDVYSHAWSGGVTENYDGRVGNNGLTGTTGASMKTSEYGPVTITVTPDNTPNSANSMALAVWQ